MPLQLMMSIQTVCAVMQSDKSDGSSDIMANVIIHGTQLLYTYLSYLFFAMLLHGSISPALFVKSYSNT